LFAYVTDASDCLQYQPIAVKIQTARCFLSCYDHCGKCDSHSRSIPTFPRVRSTCARSAYEHRSWLDARLSQNIFTTYWNIVCLCDCFERFSKLYMRKRITDFSRCCQSTNTMEFKRYV